MNELFIKELLNNLRINKTLLWNTLLITIGGTIGLFFKALNTQKPVFEIIFVILGFVAITLILNIINQKNNEISKMSLKLKK